MTRTYHHLAEVRIDLLEGRVELLETRRNAALQLCDAVADAILLKDHVGAIICLGELREALSGMAEVNGAAPAVIIAEDVS